MSNRQNRKVGLRWGSTMALTLSLFAIFMFCITVLTARQIYLGWDNSWLSPRERLSVAVSVLSAFTLTTLAALVLAGWRWGQQ